jgi:mannose-6-phosphate isomerase-like protein (cupin superfamily)
VSDVISNPVTKETVRFVYDSVDRLEMEHTFGPGGFVPVEHVHPHQEERFDVLEGHPHFLVKGAQVVGSPGTSVVVPPRTPHFFENPGPEQTRVRITFTPALRTREMFEVIDALANSGKMSKRGIPRNPFVGALLAHEFRREAKPAGAWRIPQVLAPIGAAIARAVDLRLPT